MRLLFAVAFNEEVIELMPANRCPVLIAAAGLLSVIYEPFTDQCIGAIAQIFTG